eukprot:1207282-Amphidinium_carterae.1
MMHRRMDSGCLRKKGINRRTLTLAWGRFGLDGTRVLKLWSSTRRRLHFTSRTWLKSMML